MDQLLQGILNSIHSDGTEETFINADDETRLELLSAYAELELKKIRHFEEVYFTCPEARTLFNQSVLNKLKDTLPARLPGDTC